MQEPRIEEKPELLIVGFEAAFIHALSPDATNMQVIGPLWDRLLHHAPAPTHRVGSEMYGIIYGEPESERAHRDELHYVAGVRVSSTSEIPDGMVSHRVAAGCFAVFKHRGPIVNIAETCREIYREWLPQSGFEHAGIADVELYDHRFNPESDDSEMEYWISVREVGQPSGKTTT